MPPPGDLPCLVQFGAGAVFGAVAFIFGATGQVVGGICFEFGGSFLAVIIFEIRFKRWFGHAEFIIVVKT